LDLDDMSTKDVGNVLTATGTILGGRAAALGVSWNVIKQILGFGERVSEVTD
jgi:hypothetical protein